MTIDFDYLDQTFAKFEKTLNGVDYIPFVSAISAALRLTASKIVLVAATVATIGFGVASVFNRKYEHGFYRSATYIAHSIANTIRSVFAAIPFVNLLLIAHDRNNRFMYPGEVVRIQA